MSSASAEKASPHLRMHRSAPRLRASPASRRQHLAPSSHRATATFPRAKRSQRQSTLTQLDFVASSFGADSGDDTSDKEAEWGTPVPKKRRRVNKSQPSVSDSQNTLTQMSFLVCPDSQNSESESNLEQDQDMLDHEATEQDMEIDTHIKAEPDSPQLASPSQRGKPFDIAEDSSPGIRQEQFASTQRIMDTPRKGMRGQVPSSQSPSPAPVSGSRSANAPPSLSKRQRPTLGEMTISELMRRDAQLENTPRKKHKRTAAVQDSCGEDDDDEVYDADGENVEPDWPLNFGKKTPRNKGNGEGSSRSGGSCGSRFEESQMPGLQGRHSTSPSPSSLRNSQIRPSRSRDGAFAMHLERDASPRSARRNRIASSPAGLQLEMMQEQNLNRVVACSPSSRRTLFKAPADRPSIPTDNSTSRVPSSQATTVDPTIESPRRLAQVPSSPFSTPVAIYDETQSQLPQREPSTQDWSSMTAMTALQSSGQLKTVSQLLKDSDHEDDDEHDIFCTAE